MKIPTPRKLPSGSWFVRVQVDGETYSITKPSEKECIAEAAAIKARLKEARKPGRLTVTKAIDNYIDDRKDILSPSTIRGYRTVQKQRFQSVMKCCIHDIPQNKWQRVVDLESKRCSAKTLKNSWGFLSAVILYSTGKRINVKLPQVIPNELPYLNDKQIPKLLEVIKGDPCEIAILLGLSSLRRSEILAVRWEDIDLENNCIYVHGAAVHDENGNLIYREENKNASSRRTVPFLLPQLRTAVEAADKRSEYAVTCNPNTIWAATNRACRKAGLPEVGVHGLRRSFASLAHYLGIDEEVTMKAGGWSDLTTMRKVYTKVSDEFIQDQGSKYEAFFRNCASD